MENGGLEVTIRRMKTMSNYDPHELKIVRRGVSIDKVIAAYKHFGSYRKAASVCGIF